MVETIADPADLRLLFPFIDEGVEAIKARAPHVTEIGADVYAMALDKSITIALLSDDDHPWGWTAFYQAESHDNTSDVVSWMTYIKPGAPKRILEELLDFTQGLAEATGAKHIRFMTSRMGWARRLAPHGYYVAGITLEKGVGDG